MDTFFLWWNRAKQSQIYVKLYQEYELLHAIWRQRNLMTVQRYARYILLAGSMLLAALWLPGQAKSLLQGSHKTYLPMISKAPEMPPPSLPLATTSLYMTTLDYQTIFNQGCALGNRDEALPGKQDSVVVLAFGYPRQDANGVYGTRMYYPAQPATVSQIAEAVRAFGLGYWDCVDSDFDSHLRIAVGTSNYPGENRSSVTEGHGIAWAQMVNDINDWFQNSCTRGCDGQVDAVGANDLELSWNSYDASAAWLKGYDSVNNSPMYNFGALPGCPTIARPGTQCGGGGYYWSKEQVWFVIWGSSPVMPVPEIYRTDGVNAEQWYLMSVFSYESHNQSTIQFVGPMSQYQACQQRGGCNTIDNSPEDAWWQLYNLLNGDARTDGQTLPYLTDIKWLGE